MTRVDELQKRYPSLPRQYIVRWDANVHGMRDTGKLDEFGEWVRIAGVGSYASYDFDITLKDWVEANSGRQKPGFVLRPARFVLPENGLAINSQINTRSDLEIRSEGNGEFTLYQGDERVEGVWRQPVKAKRENLTSAGIAESNFLTRTSKHCFRIQPVRHCEYFPLGVACKFCNLNPSQEDASSIGLERTTTINVEETLEVYKMFAAETRIIEGRFELGGFTKSESEAKIHGNFIEKMGSATPYKPLYKIITQPMDKKNMQRLRDVGLETICFQMEIWDSDLFAEAIPGKAQYTGRDRYLEAFQEAVEVFGAGHVSCVFVGGLSMIPENGHKTWQEARDSAVEGNTWMIRHGILPVMTHLRLPPGSTYASEENRRKAPPTEYYLEVALAHHEACKEYGLYNTLNRLLWCPIDCIGLLGCGELGAYELEGSLANWADAVLPREANWHRDWEEQHHRAVTKRS